MTMTQETGFRRLLPLGVVLLFLAAAGCAPVHKQPSAVPEYTPPPTPVVTNEEAGNPGSIFQDAQADYLFSDNRARRVGDIVLINIVETSTAANEVETTTEKQSAINLGVENFFDKQQQNLFGLEVPIGSTPAIKASSTSSFEGEGEVERSSRVSATIGARVIRVLPNDIMQVEGAREVRVDGEVQIIVIQGLVRGRDIGPDNSISSTHIANAKIDYYGQGILADKQRPGWLTRILDNVWPF